MDSTPYHFLPSRNPDDTVAVQNGRTIRAGTLMERAEILAHNLRDADALTCLCLDRTNIAITLLAGLMRGIPCVMPHDQTADTLAWIRQKYPGAVPLAEATAAVNLGAREIDRLMEGRTPAPRLEWDAASFPGDQCAVHVFTSGSTGEPRVHRKSWAALAKVARTLGSRFMPDPDSVVIATVPGQHVYGLEASIMLPLQNGGALYAGKPLLPADIERAMVSTTPPRILVSTPFQLGKLLTIGVSMPSPDLIVSATAPLSGWLAHALEDTFNTRVVEMYGSTETGVLATRSPTVDNAWDTMESVEIGFGEESTLVTAPYLEESVALHDYLEDQGDGRFHLHGRNTDMIKIAGRRCSLSEISEKLNRVSGIRDAVLYLPEDDAGSARRLVAFVEGTSLTPTEIRAALRQTLDPAFLPRPIIEVESIPRGSTGKVRRMDLERIYSEWRSGLRPC